MSLGPLFHLLHFSRCSPPLSPIALLHCCSVWPGGGAAQSKHTGGVEMARLWSGWSELGQMNSEGGTGGEQGSFMGVGGIVSDAAVGCNSGGVEMAHFQGVWGIPGGWDMLRGCSGSSTCMSRSSGAAAHGPE
jgi:hypothetical protein